MADILLVDDDVELIESLARALSPLVTPRAIRVAHSAASALDHLENSDPLVTVVDLCLDERAGVSSGFELLPLLQRRSPDMRVVVLTGHGSVSHGIRAMQLGASSFIEKPVEPVHLAAIIKDAMSNAELMRAYRLLKTDGRAALESELCGTSPHILRLREEVEFAASTNQPVLLLGETGTGKSLCARLIHERSRRRSRKCVFYHPNFAGGDIVQSELFGHVKGAFTGASESRQGLIQQADGGTVFIDELDCVPSDTQVLLLDLIQERRIRPVGSDRFREVDCRFIAATNRPVQEAITQQLIRTDLYHRIAHCVIFIPPLRERGQDIMPLAERELARICERESLGVSVFDSDVPDFMRSYQWPGNVRELYAVVEHAAYRAQFKGRGNISREDLQCRVSLPGNDCRRAEIAESFHEQVEAFKLSLVRNAVEATGGNQVQAAERLGIDRGTVRRLLASQL